jgi:pSer/pThr/pTyr-binding forkhead associated (FHA) protein
VWLDKPVLIIGRSSSADLVLQDPLVSGRHAQLRWQDGVAILDDLRSTNGTLVNGQRVTSSHAIRPGDVIQMGHTKLLFQRADHRPS